MRRQPRPHTFHCLLADEFHIGEASPRTGHGAGKRRVGARIRYTFDPHERKAEVVAAELDHRLVGHALAALRDRLLLLHRQADKIGAQRDRRLVAKRRLALDLGREIYAFDETKSMVKVVACGRVGASTHP